MKEYTRKGQLETIAPAVFVLIIAAFLLVLGMQLLGGFQNSTDDFDGTVVNESGWINQSGYSLAKRTEAGYHSPVITSIVNATTGLVISTGNYTLTGSTITNATAAVAPSVKITYTFKHGQESYKVSNSTIYDIGGLADYWELIVLAIVIGVIVTLLLLAFGSRKVK